MPRHPDSNPNSEESGLSPEVERELQNAEVGTLNRVLAWLQIGQSHWSPEEICDARRLIEKIIATKEREVFKNWIEESSPGKVLFMEDFQRKEPERKNPNQNGEVIRFPFKNKKYGLRLDTKGAANDSAPIRP